MNDNIQVPLPEPTILSDQGRDLLLSALESDAEPNDALKKAKGRLAKHGASQVLSVSVREESTDYAAFKATERRFFLGTLPLVGKWFRGAYVSVTYEESPKA